MHNPLQEITVAEASRKCSCRIEGLWQESFPIAPTTPTETFGRKHRQLPKVFYGMTFSLESSGGLRLRYRFALILWRRCCNITTNWNNRCNKLLNLILNHSTNMHSLNNFIKNRNKVSIYKKLHVYHQCFFLAKDWKIWYQNLLKFLINEEEEKRWGEKRERELQKN